MYTATPQDSTLPPLADVQFDIGADDDAIHRMTELFARHGDIYRYHSPARRAHSMYSMPSYSVKASSCRAVEPASRMW